MCQIIKLEKISLTFMWTWQKVQVMWEEGKGLSLDMLLMKLQNAEMVWMCKEIERSEIEINGDGGLRALEWW